MAGSTLYGRPLWPRNTRPSCVQSGRVASPRWRHHQRGRRLGLLHDHLSGYHGCQQLQLFLPPRSTTTRLPEKFTSGSSLHFSLFSFLHLMPTPPTALHVHLMCAMHISMCQLRLGGRCWRVEPAHTQAHCWRQSCEAQPLSAASKCRRWSLMITDP